MKKWRSILLASALLVVPIEAQAAKEFSDVPASHYAVEAIEWAEQEGIVSGDAGKFHPSKEVTEAQFVKMYAEFFGHTLAQASGSASWSTVYYDGLAHYNVPLKGATNTAARNQPITRGEVAQLIAFAHGKPSDVESAVRYMMESGISTGQNKSATSILAQYGASNTLTRAQAVAFLYRVNRLSGNTLVSKHAEEEIVVATAPAKASTEYLTRAASQTYYLGGGVQGQVMADGAEDFELKFTTSDNEVIGGYLAGRGQSLEGITVGEVYNGSLRTEQNNKSIEVLVDQFEHNQVLGIYWHYTYKAATDAMRKMESDTTANKQTDEEKLYVDLFNLTRAHHELSAVVINQAVMRVARAHSTDMYKQNYFSHTSLNGASPGDRLAAAGLTEYRTWGENISKGYLTVFHAHNGWMNSEGHRRNILNAAFEEIGFGVDNRLYTTVFFTARD